MSFGPPLANLSFCLFEWADGDSVAAHYAYGNDIFCSEDFGKGASNPSALDASNAPAFVAASGARASYRFLEFFTAQIRNPHMRRAYARAAMEFFDWLEAKSRSVDKNKRNRVLS